MTKRRGNCGQRLSELSEGPPGLVRCRDVRAEAQVLRLSLLYALLDCSETIQVSILPPRLLFETTAKIRPGESSAMP